MLRWKIGLGVLMCVTVFGGVAQASRTPADIYGARVGLTMRALTNASIAKDGYRWRYSNITCTPVDPTVNVAAVPAWKFKVEP